MMTILTQRCSRLASHIATAGMFLLFALFIYGVTMRHLFGMPQTWVDEAVTLLAAWLVFWTAAFVLSFSEYISFDVIYRLFSPATQRIVVMLGALLFIAVFATSIYGIIDYILFMNISTTDMMRIPLDRVYAIFAVFLIAMTLRLLILFLRLAFGEWRQALTELEAIPQEHS
jgi:TRAP-type C4-dicarboxylate transport system permease small subunit